MKKKLIILVEILVLIVFLRSDFAAYFLKDMRGALSNTMSSFSDLPEKRKLTKLRNLIESNGNPFSDAQKDYLIEITSTKDRLKRFYYLYCVNKDINPYIFGPNLSFTCREISRTSLLEN
jgi:hypothetical protein